MKLTSRRVGFRLRTGAGTVALVYHPVDGVRLTVGRRSWSLSLWHDIDSYESVVGDSQVFIREQAHRITGKRRTAQIRTPEGHD